MGNGRDRRNNGLLHEPFLYFQAFHIFEDIKILEVPEWQREILFQTVGAKPSVYDTEVFKHIVTEQHIYKWSRLVTYRERPGKYAVP